MPHIHDGSTHSISNATHSQSTWLFFNWSKWKNVFTTIFLIDIKPLHFATWRGNGCSGWRFSPRWFRWQIWIHWFDWIKHTYCLRIYGLFIAHISCLWAHANRLPAQQSNDSLLTLIDTFTNSRVIKHSYSTPKITVINLDNFHYHFRLCKALLLNVLRVRNVKAIRSNKKYNAKWQLRIQCV